MDKLTIRAKLAFNKDKFNYNNRLIETIEELIKDFDLSYTIGFIVKNNIKAKNEEYLTNIKNLELKLKLILFNDFTKL